LSTTTVKYPLILTGLRPLESLIFTSACPDC
jgi:hypothetical protein